MSNTSVAASTHVRSKDLSYKNLQAARDEKKGEGYDSTEDRALMARKFEDKFGAPARDWQLDVGEAICLDLDCVVIAGTGEGKTIPFQLPALRDKKYKVLVLSPLKVLQEDQVRRFRAMGIRSAAVNGDTWSPKLKRQLERGAIQAIFASPEMCLQHPDFRAYLSNTTMSRQIAMVVVDEAHCISQWGGDFRKDYANIGRLRAFFPTHVPFLATSATMSPSALAEVQAALNIQIDKAFFLNLGNDRPNVAMSVQKIKSPTDYAALLPLLHTSEDTPTDKSQLKKTIVFVNSLTSAQACARYIQEQLPEHLRGYVDYLHAQRTRRTKRRIMKNFKKNDTLILIATEAAGMGADIPDIEQVIQLGVPSSLSVWVQRAGRAGRSRTIQARAILLVEPSVFQVVKAAEDDDDDDDPGGLDGDGLEDEETTVEFRKKVEEALRQWIETDGCRRDVADEHFGCPLWTRKEATGQCCDNCSGEGPILPLSPPIPDARPQTPDQSSTPPASAPGSPNKNGKRPMQHPLLAEMVGNSTVAKSTPSKPKRRTKEYLQEVKDALTTFRFQAKSKYFPPTSFTASIIFPDRILNALASNIDINNLEELEAAVRVPWPLGKWVCSEGDDDEEETGEVGPTLFEKAHQVVREIDEAREAVRNEAKRIKLAKAAAEQERKDRNKQERERKKAEKDRLQAEKEAAKAEEQRLKAIAEEEARKRDLAMGISSFQLGSSSSPMVAFPASSSSPFTVNVSLIMFSWTI